MFQAEVKLEFVRRYCPPSDGWRVFVDIDASEMGRTGGERKTEESKRRQREMQGAGERARKGLIQLGAAVGGDRRAWFTKHGLPVVQGDRDIVAFDGQPGNQLVVAEVEGASSGQPEQKLYKAIGQIVVAGGAGSPEGWRRSLVLVVHGAEITRHLGQAHALATLGVSALSIDVDPSKDRWVFGEPLALRAPIGG